MNHVKFYIILLISLIMVDCRNEYVSSKPPIHPVPDMDHQPKYKTQSVNALFTDKAAMRMPVQGTMATGHLQEDDAYYLGVDSNGGLLQVSPIPENTELREKGKSRYALYCSPCHNAIGDGQGIIIKRGFIPPPVFWERRLRDAGDGYIFNVIRNGVRNMPSHGHLVPVNDRWAIVAYVRSLQERGADQQQQKH